MRRSIAQSDRSANATERHADEIGVERGMFRTLVALVAAWDAEPDDAAVILRTTDAPGPTRAEGPDDLRARARPDGAG